MSRYHPSVLLFLTLLLSCTEARHKPRSYFSPQRSLYDVVQLPCIPPQQNYSVIPVKKQQCPCFVAFGLSSTSASNVSVNFMVMKESVYDEWERDGFQGVPQLEDEYSAIGKRARDYSFTQSFYFYQTDNLELDRNETFALSITTSSAVVDCDLDILHVFESKPEPCPERLESLRMSKSIGGMEAVNGVENNVVAGSEVTDEAIVSYMVAISSSSGSCSGTVISKRWILTAAHCQVGLNGKAYVGGRTNIGGSVYDVKRFIPYPEYVVSNDGTMEQHDLGLVEVDKDIPQGAAVRLNVDLKGPGDGVYVRASGYGQISEEWTSSSEERKLLQVDLPIVKFEECVKAFVEWGAEDFARSLNGSGHICAGFLRGGCGGDTCYGDSGGPIVVRKGEEYVQVGIVSGGIGCAREGLPGIYTRVGRYFEWINQTTGGVVGSSVGGTDDSLDVGVDDVMERQGRRPVATPIIAGVSAGAGLVLIVVGAGIAVWRRKQRSGGR